MVHINEQFCGFISPPGGKNPIVLTERDILSICEKLKSVSQDWFTLGLAFGLKRSELKNIEDQYLHTKRRLMEMVVKRLEVTDPDHPMIWPYICECLRSPIVKRSDVAEEIEGKVPIIIMLFNIAWDHLFLGKGR